MGDFIIKGHICHNKSVNELDVTENGYAVCVGGKSMGVFKSIPKEYAALPVADHGNCLVMPGMVDLHTHAPQFTFRGMSMDLELMDWLSEYTFPEEERYADSDYAEKAYSIFADSVKKSATTRAVIFGTCHRDATGLLMKLMEESGVVSYVGKVNMDRSAPSALMEDSALDSAYDTWGFINEVKGRFSRTRPILTPRFIPSCTDELMEELRQIQMAYGIPVQSHLSENPDEIEYVLTLRPQNDFYGDAYNDYDLFGVNDDIDTRVKTVMAHCVWSTEEEIRLIEKNGVFVAHCPGSNMNLSSGIAPIRKYLDRNINVGLGTDVAGGHSDSIFRAITDAVQVSKLYWRYVDGSCPPLTFPEAFYMATRGGGRFFGKVGGFEEGCEFDAIVIDDTRVPSPEPIPTEKRPERAVYLSLDTSCLTAKYVMGTRLF